MVASLILLKSPPREKKGLDMEQNAFWLQISALKTLFSFYLNLQLQSLKGNEILPSRPVIWESGHHHFFCYSEVSLPWFGWSKQGTAWDHFPQCSQLCSRASVGTLKEQEGQLQISAHSSPRHLNQIEQMSRATRCEGRGTVTEDRGARFLSTLQSPAIRLW